MEHIPVRKKKRGNGKMTRSDAANMMYVRTNPVLMRKYTRTRAPIVQRPRDDFITMYLVKWPLSSLTRATALLVGVLNHRTETSWREAYFADNTPITYYDNNNVRHTVSYRLYYNHLYESAVARCRDGTIATAEHLITLLRACFIIGFIHDVRLRRFVMANHSIHTDYTLTQPPAKEKALDFVADCCEAVDTYLLYGDENEHCNILSMTNHCVSYWIRSCMI